MLYWARAGEQDEHRSEIRPVRDLCILSHHHELPFSFHVLSLWLHLCPNPSAPSPSFLSPAASFVSLFLGRSAPRFCRRGALCHGGPNSCDAPSAFLWRRSSQNSTSSCPRGAVSGPRTYPCSGAHKREGRFVELRPSVLLIIPSFIRPV